jgi:type I restriction enzyme S subunit
MGEIFAHDRIVDIDMELVELNESEKKNYNINENDLIFARQSIIADGAGKCSIVLKVPSLTTFESHIIRVRLNEKEAYPLFYYYFFQSQLGKGILSTIRQQGVQAGIRATDLAKIKVPKPNLSTQKKIAHIIDNYDLLIENNEKIINLILESSKHFFNRCFIDFIINNKKLKINSSNNLPDKWKVVFLTDYIDLVKGIEPGTKAYQFKRKNDCIPFIRVGDLNKRKSNIFVSKEIAKSKIANKDEILISLDGSPGLVKFDMYGCYSSGIRKAVTKQKNISNIFIYNLLNSQYIQKLIGAYSSGTTILHASSSIKKMKFILPPDEIFDYYNKTENKKFDLILNYLSQNKILEEARDIYILRLFTGIIKI